MNKSRFLSVSREELEAIVKKSIFMGDVMVHFGLKTKGTGNYQTLKKILEQYKIDFSHFKINRSKAKSATFKKIALKKTIPLEEITKENSNYNRCRLKIRLIKNKILQEKCSQCGIGNIWNGNKLVLQLDHINGVSNDNRIENLRLLCPNCHSQTKNYCGSSLKIKKPAKIDGRMCKRKVKRPLKEELEKMIKEKPYEKIGREYGVTGNAVKKWCKSYGIELLNRKGLWGFCKK